MNKLLTKTLFAVALAVPLLASAASTTYTVPKTSDSDSLTFKLDDHTAASRYYNVKVDATWDDLTLYFPVEKQYTAKSIEWTLKEKISGSFMTVDSDFMQDYTSKKETLSFSNLAEGTYKLFAKIQWGKVYNVPKDVGYEEGWIDLSRASIKMVSSVPEPETYAMLLAGLGLMGTIVFRRKNSKQS